MVKNFTEELDRLMNFLPIEGGLSPSEEGYEAWRRRRAKASIHLLAALECHVSPQVWGEAVVQAEQALRRYDVELAPR